MDGCSTLPGAGGRREFGRPNFYNMVLDAALGRLGARIDAVTYRAALHEDDRVVAVLARDCRRQAENMPGLGATGGELEAEPLADR